MSALSTIEGWGSTVGDWGSSMKLRAKVLGGKLGWAQKAVFWPWYAISAPRKGLIKGVEAGTEGAVKAAYITREAIGGVVGKGIIGSGMALVNTVTTDVRMNLWDLHQKIYSKAVSVPRGIWNLKDSIPKSFLNAGKTLFYAPEKILDQAIVKLSAMGVVREVRDTFKNFFKSLANPYIPAAAGAYEIAKIPVQSKLQYKDGYFGFYEQWGKAATQVRNSVTEGLKKREAGRSEAEKELIAKREAAKNAEAAAVQGGGAAGAHDDHAKPPEKAPKPEKKAHAEPKHDAPAGGHDAHAAHADAHAPAAGGHH